MDARTRTEHIPAKPEFQPPTFGAPQRDAIDSLIDNIAASLCQKIAELHAALDDIQQRLLETSNAVKAQLHEHVTLAEKLNDEVQHAARVLGDLKSQVEGLAP